MPELPEVETIRRELASRIEGKTIERVSIPPDPRGCRVIRRCSSRRNFLRRLAGRQIVSIGRRAKYLLLNLDDGRTLIVHLGMSGQLLFRPPSAPRYSHTRLVIHLEGGEELCFVDPRKFGEAYLFSEEEGETRVNPFALGPEPLERGWTPARLRESLRGRKGPVKAVLLDQKVVAGLGNIYTDEALFRAGIHPLRPASSLSGEEVEKLLESVREVLREAIECRGTSAADRQYVTTAGTLGSFQERLDVYQRPGRPCPRCAEPVATARIAGRTAHFCPECQI